MTQLLVEEFVDELTQPFTWKLRNRAHVQGVRLYLYTHNAPAGTFTLTLQNASEVALASKSFTAAELYAAINVDSAALPYAHLNFPLEFDNPVALVAGDYSLKLTATGYTFAESSHLAWVKEHENVKVPLGYVPLSHAQNPMTYELWGHQ